MLVKTNLKAGGSVDIDIHFGGWDFHVKVIW